MPLAQLLRLVALVFAAVTCVVLGDTAGKLLTSGGVDPFFVAWSRFALAALVLLPFSGLTRRELPGLLNWRVLVRGLFIACGITSILTALKTEPIANVFGAFFIGPVVSYVMAIVFLRERPSATRGVLLALGFAGVMLVVKPGFGATPGMGFALLAGTFYGAYLVMTRTVAGSYRPRFLLISQLLIGSVALTPFAATADLPALDIRLALLLSLSALGSALGNFLLVLANRRAEASLIAPLVYSQLISATVLGVVVFGDWPDWVALAGLLVIAASGLASLIVGRPPRGPEQGRA
ncbi:DMT family transporter [Lutimaribacter sp. EGI FJ00015]|uniref:DMT family transporter n=1 Tax=Lutimaribacter degradans TaxID=2945989 RepID=A0ACC5ZXP3_9RHOB|nr:DMT family transporter [Lutimaribacter sp. EGI FJ00013]MCM2562536.1 DMT family transporter [Lutimaribacter sp. EGI FJ00013]MCO0613693.1 DMT family transporter [Lutimaribacter sp. EGI FJ00015]MCO0636824.1 DMT family transporter [Lutimaribacter sp. EGI FJ00014]